jgi:hypothetical protein
MNDFKLFNACSIEMYILGFVDKYDPAYGSFSYCFFVCFLLSLYEELYVIALTAMTDNRHFIGIVSEALIVLELMFSQQ